MLIFVLYAKTPHAQNAHLFDPGHICKCFFSQHQGPRARGPARVRSARRARDVRTRGSRGRESPGGSEGSGWNPSSYTNFLPGWRARAGVGTGPGLPAERRPRHPAPAHTHRFPPRRPRGSSGPLRPARVYAAGPGHAGKAEARGARASPASGSSITRDCWVADPAAGRAAPRGTNCSKELQRIVTDSDSQSGTSGLLEWRGVRYPLMSKLLSNNTNTLFAFFTFNRSLR